MHVLPRFIEGIGALRTARPTPGGTERARCPHRIVFFLAVLAGILPSLPCAAGLPLQTQWTNGLRTDPGFFPIGVWLQSPRNAAKYKAAGINLYVALWRGPTEAQLAELRK